MRTLISDDDAMNTHHEHSSRVHSWRGGELVDLPDEDAPDTVVWFAFGKDDDGTLWEGLSAQTGGTPGEVTLRSVPYYVAGLALGDVVSTTVEDGVLVAVDHVTPSANLTVWVVFEAQGDEDADERWLGLMQDLEQWSCWYDVRSPLFVSVAVPALSVEPVATYLRERQDAGELRFEIGQ